MPHAKYKLYWQRYMVVEAVRAFAVGKAQCRRASRAGSAAYSDMQKEVSKYFSAAADRLPVSSGHTNDEFAKIVQKARSARWRDAARTRGDGGRWEASGTLAYQRVQRFPVRWAPPRAV